ncbi:MAG: YeeE/YedE family protein [Bacteroidia bacterium]|nr:YeeE/YedE family protein [Bacteroidia bacterium]
MKNIIYIVLGLIFGIILTKTEVISWFRIQEMFRFQSFHMYGVLFSAIVVAVASVQLIKLRQIRSLTGEPIDIARKFLNWGQLLGGLIFGLGWALTGACPGPLYALAGNGVLVMGAAILFAILGTRFYAMIRHKLPH